MRFGKLAVACATALAFSIVGCAGEVPEQEETESSEAELSLQDICSFLPCEDFFTDGDSSRWVKVGQTGDIDGIFPSSHRIDVDRRIGRVSRLQLRVRDGGVKVREARVYLRNGERFDPNLDGTYREGDRSEVVRLPRSERIDEVYIEAQKNPFFGTGSTVEVWVRR
jgi:hypothetical protein